MKFSFFALYETKTDDFDVFYTSMSDYRLRVSSMKSTFRRWAKQDISEDTYPYFDYFKFFMSGYMSYALLEKKECSKEEAIEHTKVLKERIKNRLKGTSDTIP